MANMCNAILIVLIGASWCSVAVILWKLMAWGRRMDRQERRADGDFLASLGIKE